MLPEKKKEKKSLVFSLLQTRLRTTSPAGFSVGSEKSTPSHILIWMSTYLMPVPKSFKEALKEQQALPRPYTKSLHGSPAPQNRQVSASIHPMIHPPALSSVTGDAPCCPGHN